MDALATKRPMHPALDTRLEARLLRDAGRAVADWNLIEADDRILVGCSGGKDSYTLLHVLQRMRERAPIDFSLVAVNLDQGHPGFPAHVLEEQFRAVGVEYRMLRQDTYSIVKRLTPEGKTYCAVCSRLRRGILYNAAQELGCSKIALGHHRDDLVESLLLSIFFSGKIRTMPPRLESDDGRNVVIRPLCYAAEADIAAFAKSAGFPVVPCDLCGSQENLMRKRVKRFIDELGKDHPALRGNVLAAMGNVMPEHLLDRGLHDLLALRAGGVTPDGGAPGRIAPRGKDPWLDEEEGCGEPALVPLQG